MQAILTLCMHVDIYKNALSSCHTFRSKDTCVELPHYSLDTGIEGHQVTWESVEYKLRHLAYRCIFKSTYTTYIASGPMFGQDQNRLLVYKRL